MEEGRDAERAAARPAGTNCFPPPASHRPPHSFAAVGQLRKEGATLPDTAGAACTGIKVQIMATTTPSREMQLPLAHPHPGAGMRLLLPPLPAAQPLRQRWIWRRPSSGEVRRRAEPSPLRERERPSLFTGPDRVLPAHPPRGPRGRPSGVGALPAFPRFTRAASRASETGGTPPPPRLSGLSPGRGPSGAIAAPRGEFGAMPPALRGSRGALRPGASRPVPPRGLRTHPRRSGSSRS